MKPFVIIGIGNPMLCDDGIGYHIVESLRPLLNMEIFDFFTEYICHLELLEKIEGYQTAFIIDGNRSEEQIPGRISFFDEKNYTGMIHLDNYHDFSLREMIQLAENLEIKVAEKIHVIAIEIEEDKTFCDELSKPLQQIYPTLLESCLTFVKQIAQQVPIHQATLYH